MATLIAASQLVDEDHFVDDPEAPTIEGKKQPPKTRLSKRLKCASLLRSSLLGCAFLSGILYAFGGFAQAKEKILKLEFKMPLMTVVALL